MGAAVLPGVLATYRWGTLESVPLLFLSLFPLTFFVSGLAEEPGWRGFALPRLQERYGPLPGSLILGLLWACWHLPLFLTSFEGHAGSGLLTVLGFIIGTTGMTIVITWVFNHTQGSLLLAMLGHAALDAFTASNIFSSLLALDTSYFLSVIVGFGVMALCLSVATRGHLGYRQGQTPSTSGPPLDQNGP
jgi:membrane protease YdiL (CAAX protease family)